MQKEKRKEKSEPIFRVFSVTFRVYIHIYSIIFVAASCPIDCDYLRFGFLLHFSKIKPLLKKSLSRSVRKLGFRKQ